MSQSELHSFAPRARSAHKGDFGVVLVVGGAQGYGGAAILSAEGAMRTGAGRVALATTLNSRLYKPPMPKRWYAPCVQVKLILVLLA